MLLDDNDGDGNVATGTTLVVAELSGNSVQLKEQFEVNGRYTSMVYNAATSTASENVVIGGGVAVNGVSSQFVLDFTVHTISGGTFLFEHFPVKYAGSGANSYDNDATHHQVVALMDVVTDSATAPWIVAVSQSVKRSEALMHDYVITRLEVLNTWAKAANNNGVHTFKFSASNGNPHERATPLAMHVYDSTVVPKMYILFHYDGSKSSWLYKFVGDGSSDKIVKQTY